MGGAFQEPKDIPETVTQASAAASMAMELLAPARHTLITKRRYPAEHDVSDEAPRVGVFVCHCGMNIGSVVDVERVVKSIASQPDVVLATHTMFTCSDTSLSNIKDCIRDHRLNRVVVASCTPRTHEPLFRETLREAGLNPHLFEMANIRDQCSWVHSAAPQSATEKAVELVKMSIARARRLSPLEGGTLQVDQTGLVIGAGLSGMTAALALANQGFPVHLVERAKRLGGNLHEIHGTFEHPDLAPFTGALIRQVETHPNIKLYLETEISTIKGHVGKFHLALLKEGRPLEVSGGAIVVATGARPAQTTDFLYGRAEGVITQVELEKLLHDKTYPAKGQNVVMIQCVGSRNDQHPFCSRICCSLAVKNALAIKKRDAAASVFVLYRDLRTYGFRELYYQQAREAGVVFIRYTPEAPPEVRDNQGLRVGLKSPDFPEPLEIETDNLVLSTGIERGPEKQPAPFRPAQSAAQCGRVLCGSPYEVAAGGFRDRRRFSLRAGPFAEVHRRKHLPGARRRRPRRHRAVQNATQGQRPGLIRQPTEMHLLHDLCHRLSLFRAFLQPGRQGPDRGRQVHGLRYLRRGVPGPRHPTASF